MPTRKAMAASGPMKNVRGTAMAIAIGPFSPVAMPMNTPRQIIAML